MTTKNIQFAADCLDEFHKKAFDKFKKGNKEHGGSLVMKKGLIKKAKDELIDAWFYLCALQKQLDEGIVPSQEDKD